MAPKKTTAKQKAPKQGKRLEALQKNVDSEKLYALPEAIKLAKSGAKARFDETIEISVNLGIDVKKSDQAVRGVVALPNGIGKEVRVAVFAKNDKAAEAKKAGADIVGEDDLVEQIKKGQLDFDRCIATPDMMGMVGSVARILGPRGLMPNPKLGTVTDDIAKAVKQAKSGQVEFKAEKGGIVHAGVGKASFKENDLVENIQAFIGAVKQAKPSAAKATYLKRAAVSSTMGPGIKIDISTIA